MTDHSSVLLASADESLRDGLASGLASARSVEIEIIGTVANGSDAVIDAYRQRPDVLLLDLRLPGPGAPEIVRHIGRAAPDTAVCLLVTSESEEGVSDAVDAGARDSVRRSAPPEEIAVVVGRLTRGR